MSRDKVSKPGVSARNPNRIKAALRSVLRDYADPIRKALLAVVVLTALGAARANLTPEAPTRGIGYHGEAGRSGADK